VGLFALALAAFPALAETPPTGATGPAAPPAGERHGETSEQTAAVVAIAAAASAPDPRDEKIEALNRVIEDLRRRVEELERRPTPDQAAPEPRTAPETGPPPVARPTATYLPNISGVGNILFRGGDTGRTPSRGRFSFDEFELAIQDRVSPSLRADLILAAGKEEDWSVALEEGFLTASNLGIRGLGARLGRIRTPFGKTNPLHPHQWVYVTQPAALRSFLGDHGLTTDGINVQYLLPIRGLFANLEFGRWETTGIHAHEEEEHEDDHENGEEEEEDDHGPIDAEELGFKGGEQGGYSARLWFGKAIGRDQELELGFSRYWGSGPVEGFEERADLAVNGIDLTFRSYPGPYQRLLLQAEWLQHETRKLADIGTRRRDGAFLLAAYRWNRYWEAGVRGDRTEFPFPFEGREKSISLFATKYINETTSVRAQITNGDTPGFGSFNEFFFQVLFGFGPHSHRLQ